MPNIVKYFWYWYTGLWRLRFGFCPSCNSSPPDRHCFVCKGDTEYGRDYLLDGWHLNSKAWTWRSAYRRGLQREYLV